ncbi:MAG: tetratricopeptide repeat protein [Salinivenus sp.]
MENVEEQILAYPHRSQEEQRKIELFVENHPKWAPLLRDVRTLEGFARARQERDSDPTEALLATYVTVRHLHPEEIPPALESAFRRLGARIEGDEELRRRAEVMQRRLEAAEAEIDPVAQFEALTGHSLSEDVAEEPDTFATAPVPANERTNGARSSNGGGMLDTVLHLGSPTWWVGAAIALLLGGYGVLYGISVATQSPLDRLAAVDVSEQVLESYPQTNTRGPSSETEETDAAQPQELYLEALSALRTARTSTLGLFPEYDDKKVARADRLLRDVVEEEDDDSFLALEARFYLGKALLAQRKVEEAQGEFQAVVQGDGRQAEEAQRILEALSDASAASE